MLDPRSCVGPPSRGGVPLKKRAGLALKLTWPAPGQRPHVPLWVYFPSIYSGLMSPCDLDLREGGDSVSFPRRAFPQPARPALVCVGTGQRRARVSDSPVAVSACSLESCRRLSGCS